MKAVIFDKDGTLNELVVRKDGRKTSPWHTGELWYMPKAGKTICDLKRLGYKIFVVTNQPGVNAGNMKLCDLDDINYKVQMELSVDRIISCLFKESQFYKPNNGAIEYLIKEYGLERDKSFMVGDRSKDIIAGSKSGLTTIFVGDIYSSLPSYQHVVPDYVVNTLYSVVKTIKDHVNYHSESYKE